MGLFDKRDELPDGSHEQTEDEREEELRKVRVRTLYDMKMMETASFNGLDVYTLVRRVPGGWIFIAYGGGHGVFVPFNNEGM